MSGFVSAQRTATALPKDLPPAAQTAQQHADGAIYETDDGQRFKLRHARWLPVVKRERKASGDKAGAKKK